MLAAHFGAGNKERFVGFLDNVFCHQRPGEAGPARARVIFVQRTEQNFTRNDIDINSGFMKIPEGVVKRWFCAILAGDLVLYGGQHGAQLGIIGNVVGSRLAHVLLLLLAWCRGLPGCFKCRNSPFCFAPGFCQEIIATRT